MMKYIPKNNAVQQMYADKFGLVVPAGIEGSQGTQELEPIEGIQEIQGVQDTEETETTI